ncbi:MAG TPA: FtsH protease activity modulator HflK [Vicinamibacterales bacterium]
MRDDIIDLDRLGSRVRMPSVPPGFIRIAAALLVGILFLSTTFYQVQPEAVGVVLRFGRFVRTTEPGLHVKIPLVETVVRVPVQRQLKQEFGFRTEDAAVRSRYSEANFKDESMMLTGDLNVAIVEWIIQYRVSDPYQFLFKVRNPEDTFRAMSEAIMRQVVGDRTVTEVLTVGRQEIETKVETELQALTKQYELGLTVEQVVLQDVNPPDPVKPSWDAVNQAQQQRDRLINEARAEYNKVVPRARGEAEQAILQAQGYALDRVNRSQGDSARFKAIYESYRKSPEVTRRRLYLETMQKVLPQIGGKVYLDKDAKGILPLLPLQNLMAAPEKGGGDR